MGIKSGVGVFVCVFKFKLKIVCMCMYAYVWGIGDISCADVMRMGGGDTLPLFANIFSTGNGECAKVFSCLVCYCLLR